MYTHSSNTIPPFSLFRRIARGLALTGAVAWSMGALSGCDEAQADDPDPMVEERLAQLEAKEEIRDTVMTFATIVDHEDVEGLKNLQPVVHEDFLLQAIDFDGGTLEFAGYDELISGYGPIMVASQPNLIVSDIHVEVDEDTAVARFKFFNSVTPPPQLELDVETKVLLMADNKATFVNESGTWQLETLVLDHSLAYPGAIAHE